MDEPYVTEVMEAGEVVEQVFQIVILPQFCKIVLLV